jgi:hypothetical protein
MRVRLRSTVRSAGCGARGRSMAFDTQGRPDRGCPWADRRPISTRPLRFCFITISCQVRPEICRQERKSDRPPGPLVRADHCAWHNCVARDPIAYSLSRLVYALVTALAVAGVAERPSVAEQLVAAFASMARLRRALHRRSDNGGRAGGLAVEGYGA